MTNSGLLYRGADNRTYTDINTSKTLAGTDCGVVQNIVASGVVITLPASVVGMDFTIRNAGGQAGASFGSGTNGSQAVTITPVAADGITGLGFTATVNKSIYNNAGSPATITSGNNTGAGSIAGDEIELVGSTPSSATAWCVSHAIGTWTRQT